MHTFVKVENNQIKDVKNSEWELKDGFLQKQLRGHKEPIKIDATNYTKVIFAKELQSRGSSKSNYQVDNGAPRLKTDAEIWTETGRSQKINELKQIRNEKTSQTVVELNGKTFWADPESEQNFYGRIRDMEIKGLTTTKWIQGEEIFEVTLDELKQVVVEGTKLNAAHWDEYINAVEALPE